MHERKVRLRRAKTNEVMGFPRVVVECLGLALAKHTRGWAAIEGVNMHEVGKDEGERAPVAPSTPVDARPQAIASMVRPARHAVRRRAAVIPG